MAALARAIDELRGGERAPVDWRAQLARTRRQFTAEPPAADGRSSTSGDQGVDLLDQLRTWRSNRARAAGVADHVICDDRTLQAVAEARPTTTAQLAAITAMRPGRLARWGDQLLTVVADAGNDGAAI